MPDDAALAPKDFVALLKMAQERFEAHPLWKMLDGTPWQNDAPVIAVDLMRAYGDERAAEQRERDAQFIKDRCITKIALCHCVACGIAAALRAQEEKG